MNLAFLGIGSLVDGVGKIVDDLVTTDEERLKLALQGEEIEAGVLRGQMEVNKAEAQNPSVLVAGWRPFIGWVGGIALAYQFILYPLMTWVWTYGQGRGWIPPTLKQPPVLEADVLWVIVTGMLGIAGMRSFDKLKGTDVKAVTRQAHGTTGQVPSSV
jgi:hypothetical protein